MGLFLCCCCCFEVSSSKCIEVTLIILNSIGVALTLLDLIIISWDNLSNFCLILYIVILILFLVCLIFSILFTYWRNIGSIKEVKQPTALQMAKAGFGLMITLLIVVFLEEIFISLKIREVNYPCLKTSSSNNGRGYDYYRRLTSKNYDCSLLNSDYFADVISKLERTIVYLTLSFFEIMSILGIFLFHIDKNRIFYKTDKTTRGMTAQVPVIGIGVQPVLYDNYGRPYSQQQIQQIMMQPQIIYVENSPNENYQSGQNNGYISNQVPQQIQNVNQNPSSNLPPSGYPPTIQEKSGMMPISSGRGMY